MLVVHVFTFLQSSSRMHVMNHNWSVTKQYLYLHSTESSRDKQPFSFVREQYSTFFYSAVNYNCHEWNMLRPFVYLTYLYCAFVVARTCSLIFMVLDVLKPLQHKKILEHELEGFGLRLNKTPPNITFRRKDKGGINLTATVWCQNQCNGLN